MRSQVHLILGAVASLLLAVVEGQKEVCMDEIGCFAITDEFKDWKNRPINFLPKDRLVINTKFLLYTKEHPKELVQLRATKLDEDKIKKSKINPNHPTKFIVHGFMDRLFFGPWMEELKDNMLLYESVNVIIVEWSGGNGAPYTQATANTRVVGAEVALFIELLEKNTGVKRKDCHIIGHSLGSHIAGYAGERLKGLGRITGLDPAEPYFQNMPPIVRLDPTDAKFVDVIHSDSKSILLLGFGMSQACGHVDFYPNNGRDQPGCVKEKYITFPLEGLISGLRRFVACNHQRAVDFFTHSINFKSVPQVGFSCTSWEDFIAGKCADCGKNGEKCAIMGIRAIEFEPHKDDENSLELYLKTSGKRPFWLSHYQVVVKMHNPPESKSRNGYFQITLVGSNDDIITWLNEKSVEFTPGSTYNFLVTSEKKLEDLKGVTLLWQSSGLLTFFAKDVYVDYVEVVPMTTMNPDAVRKKYCENKDKPIKHKESRTYFEACK